MRRRTCKLTTTIAHSTIAHIKNLSAGSRIKYKRKIILSVVPNLNLIQSRIQNHLNLI